MNNPLNSLAEGIEKKVKIALMREAARAILSRLITLDPDQVDQYKAAIGAIGEGD